VISHILRPLNITPLPPVNISTVIQYSHYLHSHSTFQLSYQPFLTQREKTSNHAYASTLFDIRQGASPLHFPSLMVTVHIYRLKIRQVLGDNFERFLFSSKRNLGKRQARRIRRMGIFCLFRFPIFHIPVPSPAFHIHTPHSSLFFANPHPHPSQRSDVHPPNPPLLLPPHAHDARQSARIDSALQREEPE